ncbi:hypothetical protein [Pedobacter sp. SYSU D00535]|uniref:hypothetical protein n=1 Tax=Pedobacter sp. SYSU D00535 TaxID=2810308 RepID=UPI001A97779F|nr:hypothetical protein [Pedobacter sp. SYSU D00535]
MKKQNNNNKVLRLFSLVLAILLFSVTVTLAAGPNVFDSDLSNDAGTNKNWHNALWFFVCVTFLVAAAYVGFSRPKDRKVRRNRNELR